MEKRGITEAQRKAIVASEVQRLKHMPYDDYLKTAHWKRKRTAAVLAAGGRCQLCYTKGRLEVHHRTYVRKGKELPSDLIALCPSCHSKVHSKK